MRAASIGILAVALSAGVTAAGGEANDLDRELAEIVRKGLRYDHPDVRESAAGVVRSVGARSAGAADALATALVKEAEAKPRRAMGYALVRLGPAGAEAIEKVLGSAEREGLRTLAEIASRSKPRPMELLKILGKCPDATVHTTIRRALKRAGAGAESWREGELAGMAKADSAARRQFLPGLSGGGVRPEHEPFLIGCLSDTGPWVQEQAARFLGDIEPHTKRKIDALEAALAKADSNTGQTIMRTIAKAGDLGVDALVRALDHPNRLLRTAAASNLARLGPKAERALPALRNALEKAPIGFKTRFEEAIAKVSGDEESLKRKYVEALRAKSRTKKEPVEIIVRRAQALSKLSRMGRDAEFAKEALWDYIRDADYSKKNRTYSEHTKILRILVTIGRPASGYVLQMVTRREDSVKGMVKLAFHGRHGESEREILMEGLRSADPAVRLWALQELDKPGWGRKLAPTADLVLSLADDRDAEVRKLVASIAKNMGVSVADRGKLLAGLKDRDFLVRKQTALTLAKGAAPPDEAIPVLAEVLTHERGSDKRREVVLTYVEAVQVLRALAKAGARARPALGAVVRSLPKWLDRKRRFKPAVAIAAVAVLANFPAEARDSLLLSIKEGPTEARKMAATALSGRGLSALKEQLERFRKASQEERGRLSNVTVALAAAGGEPAVKLFLPHLASTDKALARLAADAIRGIGAPAVPALLELAGSPDRATSATAMGILQGMGGKAKAALPRAIAMARSSDRNTRWGGLAFIAAVGGDDPTASKLLLEALSDRDPLIRLNVARVIGGSSIPAQPVLRALGKLLDDRDANVRSWAIMALGGYEEAALPLLKKAFADPVEGNRKVVVFSISQIGIAALPVVARALRDRSAVVRETAADSLKRFGSIGVIPLLDAYREGGPEIRAFARERLKGMGKLAAPGLLEMLR